MRAARVAPGLPGGHAAHFAYRCQGFLAKELPS